MPTEEPAAVNKGALWEQASSRLCNGTLLQDSSVQLGHNSRVHILLTIKHPDTITLQSREVNKFKVRNASKW
jgi:hypothetical protein